MGRAPLLCPRPQRRAGRTVFFVYAKAACHRLSQPIHIDTSTQRGSLGQQSHSYSDHKKAPAGYDLYKPSKAFKAKPNGPVTVTKKPTDRPSGKPSADKPGKDEDAPAPSASDSPISDETTSSTAAPVPTGALAHTGADATPWLIGGAGVLIAAGGGALFVARRRRTDNSDDGSTAR